MSKTEIRKQFKELLMGKLYYKNENTYLEAGDMLYNHPLIQDLIQKAQAYDKLMFAVSKDNLVNKILKDIDNDFVYKLDILFLGEKLEKIIKENSKLKKTPTTDEVCEALSKYWGNPIQYDKRHRIFDMYVGDNIWKPIELLRLRSVPHLITLIGRFYEGINND